MPDFKMSEMEREEASPLRDFTEETSPLRNEDGPIAPHNPHPLPNDDFDDEIPRKKGGSWLGGIVLFILIAAVAALGYYGYNDLKQTQELNNVYGSGEFNKLEKKFEALLNENNFKLEKTLQEAANQQTELADKLAAAVKKADGTATELAKSNKNLANLQKLNSELTEKYNATVKDLEETKQKLAAVDALSKQIANTEARVNDLESTISTTANSVTALTQSSAKINEQITALAKQQAELSNSIAEVAKIQAANTGNAALTSQLKQLQAELDKANLEILKIKNLADANVTKELNTIKNELGDLKRKVDLLQ